MERNLFTDLRAISDALGSPFTLRAHQSLMSFEITDETVMVALTVHRYTETVREVRFTAEGTRIITFKKVRSYSEAYDYWMETWDRSEMTLWDDDFTPYSENRLGKIESLTEYTERRAWEAMQYRVGSSRNPMDNADRSADPTYSPMHNYWMKG